MKFFITFCFIALCAISLANADKSESEEASETPEQREEEETQTEAPKQDRKGGRGGRGGGFKGGKGGKGIGLPDPQLVVDVVTAVGSKVAEAGGAVVDWVKGAANTVAGWFGK